MIFLRRLEQTNEMLIQKNQNQYTCLPPMGFSIFKTKKEYYIKIAKIFL